MRLTLAYAIITDKKAWRQAQFGAFFIEMPDYYNRPTQLGKIEEVIPEPWSLSEDVVQLSPDDKVGGVSEVTFAFPIPNDSDVDTSTLRDQLYRGQVMSRLREHFESAEPPIRLTNTSYTEYATPVLGETIAEVAFATRWPIPENFGQTLNGAREIIGDVMLRACIAGSSWRDALTQIQSLEATS